MRQGQQNRRGRGRNNNNNNNNNQNRKGQNPLTRSFESNGPDMKIRGTPAHIAEKYIALARDAHSAGDPVLAENYLQHAEHYNRIILAYREQQMSQGGGDMGNIARPRPAQLIDNTDGEDADDEEGGNVDPSEAPQPVIGGMEGQSQPQAQQQRNFDQPRFERPHRSERQDFQHRQHRDRDRDRQDRNENREHRFERGPRHDRGERFGGERGDRGERHQGGEHREGREFREPRGDRDFREPRGERSFGGERPAQHERPQQERPERAERAPVERAPVEAGAETGGDNGARASEPRRRERFAGSTHEQPEFLRRPVRRPRRESSAEADAPAAPAAAGTDEPRSE